MDKRFQSVARRFEDHFNKISDNDLGAEIVDIAEVLRCQVLEMEKVIKAEQEEALSRGYLLDPLKLKQPLQRLQALYQQITGFGVDDYWDKVKERREPAE